jgi:hypothetical protein
MADYANFRQRLDAVLRTLDVKQVQNFLVAEKQWQPGQPVDPEYAMWMMIAGSPALRDLHDHARQWLVTHGHEAEADALLRREKRQGSKQGKRPAPGGEKGGGKFQAGKSQKNSGASQKKRGRT